ncbi:YybH family protein [Aliiruegeria lutimaris]|uniref:SnoaL-like domain-containing protein n=1 Tax=Aliiruegeria lutimaris TaxID=571298 RepID=A0A1G8LGS3_9RHOB|nr:SgcJ/EcaC family oxidoreductase [Aliiruegeria lutimaris]SDI54884.1 conserved hypothetical protein [Aliiruegeria lutimaris]
MDPITEFQSLFDRYVAAYRSGDAAGCAALFTENAQMHSPYAPPAHGRSEIEAVHRDWTSDDVSGKEVVVLEAGMSGDLAWCLAEFREDATTDEGTSLNLLERQKDGNWLIRVCSLNEAFAPEG